MRWMALPTLALLTACAGSGSSKPAVIPIPLVLTSSTAPAMSAWAPGQELTLKWTLGGGAPTSEFIVLNSYMAQQVITVPLGSTSYTFTPPSGVTTVYLFALNNSNMTTNYQVSPQAEWTMATGGAQWPGGGA